MITSLALYSAGMNFLYKYDVMPKMHIQFYLYDSAL